jgi:hypothetical protein
VVEGTKRPIEMLFNSQVTVPVTGVTPGPTTVNVVSVIVAAFIASLKVALTVVSTGTLFALVTVETPCPLPEKRLVA